MQHPQDSLDHALGVREHVIVPETNDAPTLGLQEHCAPLVLYFVRMLPAIRFNDELVLCAREIDDEITDRMLTVKPVASQTAVAQNRPQPALGVG